MNDLTPTPPFNVEDCATASRHATGRHIPGLAVLVFSIFCGVYWAERPVYNWDMLGYIAVALHDAGTPEAQIHALTYASLSPVPERARLALTEDDGGYRSHVAKDSQRFLDELPFYAVKPLYPWLVSLLYREGVGLVRATVIISATAYALAPILFFLWFRKFTVPSLAAALSCCVAVMPFLARLAGSSTPDSLSFLIVLAALYLGFAHNRLVAAAALLTVSILARPENLIYAGSYLCYLLLSRKIRLPLFAAAASAALALFFGLTKWAGSYGYKTLIYYTFVSYDIDVKHFVSPLQLTDYVMIYVRGLDNLIFNPVHEFGIFAALAVGTVAIAAVRHSWSDKYVQMLGIAAICAAFRFALLPAEFGRALIVPYAMVLIAFVSVCRGLAAQSPIGRQH